MLNIVFLDGKTINPGDLTWEVLQNQGNLSVYSNSTKEEGIKRAADAEVVLTNKFVIDRDILSHWPKVKCICVTATGYNNIDLQAVEERGILVCNVSGYSQYATAQHAIALLLELANHCGDYHQSVQNNDWHESGEWTYTRQPIQELNGLTLGLIGYGSIGRQTGKIAKALGMKIIAFTRSQQSGFIEETEMVQLGEIWERADVISLHTPLNNASREIINRKTLNKMKNSALLINTARGGLINELDLRNALISKTIAGAALDVLSIEPPPLDHPLIGVDNCIITPHLAWASKSARQRLLDITAQNIAAWFNGNPQNVVRTS